MPKRIDPKHPAKVVAFTLRPSDIETLNLLAERDGLNRSAWVRRQININAPLVVDLSACDHPPVVKDENHRSWWVRLGKTNPLRHGGHCVGCWGETKPVRRQEYGRTVWILGDGTEVVA